MSPRHHRASGHHHHHHHRTPRHGHHGEARRPAPGVNLTVLVLLVSLVSLGILIAVFAT